MQSRILEERLDEDNIVEWMIGNHQLFMMIFSSKLPKIYEIQKNMLLNDLKDEQSKRILLQYLKNEDVQKELLNQVNEDQVLMEFKNCLNMSGIRTESAFQAKYHDFIKNAEKKCKNVQQSLTLKKQYEPLLKSAQQCFKLKVSDSKPNRRKSGGKRANTIGWKVNIPNVDIETNFICAYCQKSFQKRAGLVVHEKMQLLKRQKQMEEENTKEKSKRNLRSSKK